jgi:hypothetical protein
MKTLLPLFALDCLSLAVPVVVSAESVRAPGAQLEPLAGDFKFTEAPPAMPPGD